MLHLSKNKAQLESYIVLNNEHTSTLIYSEFFHSVNKLPELLISTFCNKLTAQEEKLQCCQHQSRPFCVSIW